MTCGACGKPAEYTMVIKIIPRDSNVPEQNERTLVCKDHLADPGPLVGWSYSTRQLPQDRNRP